MNTNKVAQVTLPFWIMKICATTVGETGGDLLSMTLSVGYAVSSLILIGFFIVAPIAQLKAKTFHPVLYWASSWRPAPQERRSRISWTVPSDLAMQRVL